MARIALPSTLLLAIALAACGGSKKTVKLPQVSIPGPQAWDGQAAAGGTVTFISTLPGDKAKFVAYEVNPSACTINRTVVDEVEKLGHFVTATITNPMDGAGTVSQIRTPPPPPPGGQDLLFEAIRIMGGDANNHTCQPMKPQ